MARWAMFWIHVKCVPADDVTLSGVANGSTVGRLSEVTGDVDFVVTCCVVVAAFVTEVVLSG